MAAALRDQITMSRRRTTSRSSSGKYRFRVAKNAGTADGVLVTFDGFPKQEVHRAGKQGFEFFGKGDKAETRGFSTGKGHQKVDIAVKARRALRT
jgi:hypothetical protein